MTQIQANTNAGVAVKTALDVKKPERERRGVQGRKQILINERD